jgi:hypothetical protein
MALNFSALLGALRPIGQGIAQGQERREQRAKEQEERERQREQEILERELKNLNLTALREQAAARKRREEQLAALAQSRPELSELPDEERAQAALTQATQRSTTPRQRQTVFTDQGLLEFDEESGEWIPARVSGGQGPVRQPSPSPGLVTSREGVRVPDVPGTEVAPPGGTGSAALVKAVTVNRGKIKVIDDALLKLRQRPEGVGVKGLVPDIVLQRMDPEGVALRAAIADIGSLVIHDRSGAAVTAAEMPRLEPFIPRDYDTPATLRTKLQRMKEIIEEETSFLDENRQRSGTPPTPATRPTPRASTGVPTRFLPGAR